MDKGRHKISVQDRISGGEAAVLATVMPAMDQERGYLMLSARFMGVTSLFFFMGSLEELI